MSERLKPMERIRLAKLRIKALEENRAGYTHQRDMSRAWNSTWSCLFRAEEDLRKEQRRSA